MQPHRIFLILSRAEFSRTHRRIQIGALCIHRELLKVGLELYEATAAKYMVHHRKPPTQTWRTFLANHMKDMVSSDFLVVSDRVLSRAICLRDSVARPPSARPGGSDRISRG